MSPSLADDLARFVYGVRLPAYQDAVGDTKALLLDAVAAILSGLDSEAAVQARRAFAGVPAPGAAVSSLFGTDEQAAAASCAMIHGAALRFLDVMDYYVSTDVSHPSEIVPVILAYAQAARASGKETLECMIAGYAVHIALTDTIPLHSVGLHHVGQASIVVPLVVSRLMGLDVQAAARAVSISAARFFVPEGFAKGHLAKVKALAYPLLARQALEAVELAAHGFAGNPQVLEEILEMLERRFGVLVSAQALVAALATAVPGAVLVKAYPAQYALQGLIAAAVQVALAEPQLCERIERIEIHSSARSLERAADAAKFKPASREAADHSMPFCVAIALLDARMDERQLELGRWKDADVLALMSRIETYPLAGDFGFHTGPQRMVLHLAGGEVRTIECPYPSQQVSQWAVALEKLQRFNKGWVDARRVAETIGAVESLDDISVLCRLLTRQKKIKET